MFVWWIVIGVECLVFEVVVCDVFGYVEILSDFSCVDVELEIIETTVIVYAVKNFVDFVNVFGFNVFFVCLKWLLMLRLWCLFIDDVLLSGLVVMYVSAYEEANDVMGESMGDSVYEDLNEELNEEFFDDVEVVIWELLELLGIDFFVEFLSVMMVFIV